jgi:hypothetical protein
MSTYEQLLRRYDRPCLPLEEVRKEWIGHISNEQHLLTEIRKGTINLRYTRLHSKKSQPVVYLRDLAAWLDSQDPSNTQPAADQAA